MRLEDPYARLKWRDPLYLHFRSLIPMIASAAQHARGKLLDVGCGRCPYRSLFAPHVSWYVGVDMDFSDTRPDARASGAALPFRQASFDTVFCTQVLEHTPEPRQMLAQIAGVLKPGGRLIMTVPQQWRLHEEPYDFFRYTRYGLEHLLEQAGFTDIELEPQGGAWALAGQVIANTIRHRWVFRRLVIPLLNLAFAALDDWFFDPGDTMNYLVLATRSSS